MSKARDIWERQANEDDLEAARAYLSMVLDARAVSKAIAAFRKCKPVMLEAKDVLRASNLPLVDEDEPKVAKDIKKIKKKEKLSPVLLIRGDALAGAPMTIADGYHRICASFCTDKKEPVACCLISL